MFETPFNTPHQLTVYDTNDFAYHDLITYPYVEAPQLVVSPPTCISTRVTPDGDSCTWSINPSCYSWNQCHGNFTAYWTSHTNVVSVDGLDTGRGPDVITSTVPLFQLPRDDVRHSSSIAEAPDLSRLAPVDQTEIPSVEHSPGFSASSGPFLKLPLIPHCSNALPSEGPSTPQEHDPLSPSQDNNQPVAQKCYTTWKKIPKDAIVVTGSNLFVPQRVYKPFTEADQIRYLEKVSLFPPILFVTKEPYEWGIALVDALRGNTGHLVDKDDYVLQDCGPSVSIRINWPGYPSYKRQISSRAWNRARDPLTKARLAKSIAKTVDHFIEKMSKNRLTWRRTADGE